MKTKNLQKIKKGYNSILDDYLMQLKILVKAGSMIMGSCGNIFPAMYHIESATREVREAIIEAMLHLSGLDEETKRILSQEDYKRYLELNKEFNKWRENEKKRS